MGPVHLPAAPSWYLEGGSGSQKLRVPPQSLSLLGLCSPALPHPSPAPPLPASAQHLPYSVSSDSPTPRLPELAPSFLPLVHTSLHYTHISTRVGRGWRRVHGWMCWRGQRLGLYRSPNWLPEQPSVAPFMKVVFLAVDRLPVVPVGGGQAMCHL